MEVIVVQAFFMRMMLPPELCNNVTDFIKECDVNDGNKVYYPTKGGIPYMKVTVEKINQEDLKKQGVFSWPIWQKEISDFDWYYDTTEQFYVLEGEVEVETEDGQKVVFGPGDFVTFPKGVKCRWHVKKPIRKHYNFK